MTQDYTSSSGTTTSGAIRRGFDNHQVGESYDRDKQEQDWAYQSGASNTARIAEISDEQSVSGGQSLKVNYSSEERVKTASRWELPEEQEYFSSYWVYFPEEFEFNGVEKSGGKLPGLGSDEVPTGGDDVTGDNGFSARYMWRYDGQAELYLYHMDKAGTFGDSVKFQYDNGDYAFFEKGTWQNIIQRVKTNTGTDADGEIDVWLDGEQVVDIDGVRLSDDGQLIDIFYLSTFYGGGSAGWLPPEDTSAYFDDIVISTEASDVGLDASQIRAPGENPDQRTIGNGVVRGIREFEPRTTEQTLPNGEGAVLHDKQWGDGFTATLFFTPDEDIENWTIQIRTPGPIEDIWNAEIVSFNDGIYTLRGTTKPQLDAGETANIRIKAEGHGSLVEFVGGGTATPVDPGPVGPDPIDPDPVDPDPVDPDPVDPTPVDPDPVPTPDTGDISINVDREWQGGFTADIAYRPTIDAQNWTIQIRSTGQIENVWNAQIVSQEGDIYTLKGASYNADLDAGETARIRIKAAGDAGELTALSDTNDAHAQPDPTPPVVEPTPDPIPDEEPVADPTPPATGLDVDFAVGGRWNGGFKGELSITNTTGQAISDWTLSFAMDGFSIRDMWGGDLTTAEGIATIDGSGWTTQIDPGETVSFGFVADGTPPAQLADLSIALDGTPSIEPDPDTGDTPDPGTGDTPDPDTGNTPPNGGRDAPPDPSPTDGSPFSTADYAEVLNKSMQFYYAQYAGELLDDHPIPWRGDSTLDDGAEVGRDLSGGWFDAGDHVKFGLPMAATATTLAWGGLEFDKGYKDTGAYDDLDTHLRHVSDYFLQAYDDKGTADISDDVFHAQVGDGNIDHAYWGAPEDMTMERPVYSINAENPGTEVAAETAAALAASSMFFRAGGDAAYADELLTAAEKLFDFAETYQGTYNSSVPDAAQFYESFNGTYEDELSWAAIWLHKATGDDAYLDMAENYWDYPWATGAQSWDNKTNGTTLLLAQETGDARYVDQVQSHFDHWINDIDRTPGTDTNDGLGWLMQWGSNRLAANTAFLSMVHAKDLAEDNAQANASRVDELREFASDQLDYMMGDNPQGQSFVVGFGDTFPQNPHHRAASGTTNIEDPDPNEYVLNGALVGGPLDTSGTYNDDRTDFISNEVATDYNAGFSGALAGLYEGLEDGWM